MARRVIALYPASGTSIAYPLILYCQAPVLLLTVLPHNVLLLSRCTAVQAYLREDGDLRGEAVGLLLPHECQAIEAMHHTLHNHHAADCSPPSYVLHILTQV